MISFKVHTHVDDRKLNRKRAGSHRAAQIQLDQDVLKDSNFFIPKQTGNLERSGILHSLIGQGKIIWKTVYARRLYYNPQYHFSKDVNPFAQGLWFEAAKKLYKKDWLREIKGKYRHFFNGR